MGDRIRCPYCEGEIACNWCEGTGYLTPEEAQEACRSTFTEDEIECGTVEGQQAPQSGGNGGSALSPATPCQFTRTSPTSDISPFGASPTEIGRRGLWSRPASVSPLAFSTRQRENF